jgi:hypothetical protein
MPSGWAQLVIVLTAMLLGAAAVFAAELAYCSYFAIEHPWKSLLWTWLR